MTDTLKNILSSVQCSSLDSESDRRDSLASALDREDLSEDVFRQLYVRELSYFELMDRSMLQLEFWERYILNHPACLLNPDLYRLGHVISYLMCDFYQQVGHLDTQRENYNGTIKAKTHSIGTGTSDAIEAFEGDG